MSLIKITDNSYNDANALSDVFSYCGNVNKCVSWKGLGICLNNIHTAIDSMRVVQKIYGKEKGKHLYHIIISVDRKMYVRNKQELNSKIDTERICRSLIGMQICEYIYNMGFQNAYFLHDDSEYLHLHIIVNSVSYINGKKLTNLYRFVNDIKQDLKEEYSFLQWEC